MSCLTCGAATSGRPGWNPTICEGQGPGRFSTKPNAGPTERRHCARCGVAFCVRAHRPQTYCSQSCFVLSHTDGLLINGGRRFILCRDGSKFPYARAVMWAHAGRELAEHEVVHHRNGDTLDDRIENLALLDRGAHMNEHRDDLERARDAARPRHCPQGHEFTPENTYRSPQGWRSCRTCNREKARLKREAA